MDYVLRCKTDECLATDGKPQEPNGNDVVCGVGVLFVQPNRVFNVVDQVDLRPAEDPVGSGIVCVPDELLRNDTDLEGVLFRRR